MKTKIVYVVASLDNDVYMEQAVVSAWSARHYNPDSQIEMVCDQDTFATLDSGIRARYKSLFNKIHVREFRPEQSMMERSRWMKTTLREIVEGDFLYLDSDTVVCTDLSSVDEFDFDLGMVLDQNCEFEKFIYRKKVVGRTQRLYGVDLSKEKSYFNSGVAFVRDCAQTRVFYKSWHEFWKSKIKETEGLKDQSALASANIKHNHLITEMDGTLNCQVMASIQYLHTAKIMHYFNTLFTANCNMHPFYGKSLFEFVKQNGITEDIQCKIINNKSLFSSPSMPVPREGALLWRDYSNGKFIPSKLTMTKSFRAIQYISSSHPKLFRRIEKFWGWIIEKRH